MTDIYKGRLRRFRRPISKLRNGDVALRFLDNLSALGLFPDRVSKYAGHLPILLRVIDFNLKKAMRSDVEKVAAWINSQPYREIDSSNRVNVFYI